MFYLVVGVKLKRKVSACVMFSLDVGIVVSILNMGEWGGVKKQSWGSINVGQAACFAFPCFLYYYFSFPLS